MGVTDHEDGDFPWIAVRFMEKHDPQVLCNNYQSVSDCSF